MEVIIINFYLPYPTESGGGVGGESGGRVGESLLLN